MSDQPRVVSVAFPIAIPGLYDYHIPDKLVGRVTEGCPVLVDVRSRHLWGMAVHLRTQSSYPNLKDIIDAKPVLRPEAFRCHIALYEWIASYYQCELGAVFKPFVRKGLLRTEARQMTCYAVGDVDVAELTPKQRAMAERLRDLSEPVPRAVLQQNYEMSDHMVKALCKAGALVATSVTVQREADELRMERSVGGMELTDEQQSAVETLVGEFDVPTRPYLLHGITGSGKTLVYIELVKHALARGKGAIVLVPEISLTPQTIQRFASAMGDTIAVIHSHMSDGERRDSLEQLMDQRKRVVIGARSAILAPIPELGVIIVDEEHDGSYKQSESEPRYHARDVAIMRGALQKTLVILGSATPSLESHHNAVTGKYGLLPLYKRFGTATLPRVTLVDMNDERRDNNWTLLSRYLEKRIGETLADHRQVILLLNRRGFSTFLICKDCGYTHTCPNCSVNLVYHRTEAALRCHQCGHFTTAPTVCDTCKGEQVQYRGTGIQKAEEHLRALFSEARIARMDQDTTRRKGAHISILESVARRDIDILLGTQMVAKGLDFPGVALVGVLQADTGLHIPDFRASEKTFQLLTQVAGRAGRADNLGEVVVQTNLPDDFSVQAAAKHDYNEFISHEMRNREELGYPPFCRLARIVVSGPGEKIGRAHV